jgi:predicted  nucleic acid-binding Zn-ribbon protein
MGLSEEDAKILWNWKGERELSEIKAEIRDLKKRIQSLANKLASKKGLSDKRLNLLVALAKTLEERRKYLNHIYDIRDMAI